MIDLKLFFFTYSSKYLNSYCSLQAYLNHRAERIRNMRWQFGAVLPPDVKANLCEAEQNFFTKYNRDLVSLRY